MELHDEVDYVSGKTRVFGIVGHPIEQVRSPEMFTAEFRRRGHDAILVPMHVLPDDFDAAMPQLLRLRNLGGLVFTIPFKVRACAFADELGDQARVVGAINALAKGADGHWHADIFDGLGCVEAFRRREIGFTGKRVMLLGAGGAGSAIGVAIGVRAARVAARIRRRSEPRASAGRKDRARQSRRCRCERRRRRRTASTSSSTRRPSACWMMRGCRIAVDDIAARTGRLRRRS